VVTKMKASGEVMEESVVVSKILRSLTLKFNYATCSIEKSNDLGTLTIDEPHDSLLVHEQRMQGFQIEEQVLKITTNDRPTWGRGGRGAFRGGRNINNRARCGRGRQSFNKAFIECFKCHKMDHFQHECPDFEK